MKRCYDCKKILWPWQARGIDNHSHRPCHRLRCLAVLEKFPSVSDTIAREIREIESFYRKFESALDLTFKTRNLTRAEAEAMGLPCKDKASPGSLFDGEKPYEMP